MGRVLLIGIDGADFDVVKPMVAAGHLPNLGRLIERGAHGNLGSVVPPMSPAAWTSFMTGRNPGSHGVFDFTARKPGSYSVEFVNARFRRAPTLWRRLSDAGKRVAVLSVPITYPPEPLNGCQVSGIDTPGITGGEADPTAFHPPELDAELRAKVGPYLVSPSMNALDSGRVDEALAAVFRTIDRKLGTACYLYAREPWDCFMVVVGETDAISHRLWKAHDPESPLREPAAATSAPEEDPLLAVYRRIDGHVGRLVALAPPDTTVLVMSDHGHAGNGDKAVYLNRWLASRELLHAQQGGERRLLASILALAKRIGTRSRIPLAWRKKLFRRTRIAGRVESFLRFGRIDWSRTLAFSEETPYYPTIWINVRGREPMGVVEPGAPYEELRSRILAELAEWRDPDSGRPVVKRAWRREELYHGPFVVEAPDIVIDWALDGRWSYVFRQSGERTGAPIERLGPEERQRVKSGDHRDFGLLIAAGNGIAPGAAVEGMDILDLAPTVMHLLGLPVPAELEGRVLDGLFSDEFRRGHAVRKDGAAANATAPAAPAASGPAPEYSPDEEEAVKERLRGLGYLE